MKEIYTLRRDSAYTGSMQKASLDTNSIIGLRVTHGLIGSPSWWKQIEEGLLPSATIRGVISGFWPGQWGGGPVEFELQDTEGSRSKYVCGLDPVMAKGELAIGRAAEVDVVIQELKSPFRGSTSFTVLLAIRVDP